MNFLSLFSGSSSHDYKTNFEHVQHAIRYPSDYCLINTLPVYEQGCLIETTLHAGQEESFVNDMIYNVRVPDKKVIVYGKHANDHTVESKYQQLVDMGLSDVYVYTGGMFEWLLLQDIYGAEEFPTTQKVLDLLKFRPLRCV
jgi:rhodanese-related sulfurtransferase